MKAKMLTDVAVAQVDKYSTNKILPETVIKFKKGMEVEILKVFHVEGSPYTHYVIFSEKLGESTTVYEEMLDFI